MPARRRPARATALCALAATAALAAFPSPIAAHGGHGPTFVVIGGLAFAPTDVTVVAGDAVTWSWQGPDTNHSVTANPGQAEAFDTDPGKAPAAVSHKRDDGFAYDFLKPGTFTYACKVHPTMTGTVTVLPAPPAPPADKRAPKLTRLALTPSKPCATKSRACSKPGALLKYRTDEDADVTATLTKKGARKPARRAADIAFEGANELRLRLTGLSPGVYTLRLTATDDSKNDTTARLTIRIS